MNDVLHIVGPEKAVELLGIRLVGVSAENGKKLLFTVCFVMLTILVGHFLNWVVRSIQRKHRSEQTAFWARQGVSLSMTVILILGIASIWFNDPTKLTTALGLVTAGLAFALQKVVTAVAGYVVILRGKTFNVGDRITMGGVRGDVVALGFTQTTLMEMGQPPSVQGADPAMWVKSRQYTGRIVTVSNAKIFDEPVYNYSREFPYIWEEMSIPVSYTADHKRAEQILLDVANRNSIEVSELSSSALAEIRRRYFMKTTSLTPRVYLRLTDNWLELTVRFIVADHGIRDVKDRMSRELLEGLNQAGISIASATFEITGLPELRISNSLTHPRVRLG
jgi:small-conductance mechanosensitive channel